MNRPMANETDSRRKFKPTKPKAQASIHYPGDKLNPPHLDRDLSSIEAHESFV
jgi:hypothetical protein